METFDDNTMDWTDLACVIQRLRWLGWSASLDRDTDLAQTAMIWFEHVDKFAPVIERLRANAVEATDPEIRQRLEYYADQYERVHAALVVGPRRPSDEELVLRYVVGEIGDRTVKYITGWDSWRLIDECHDRGLPPMQVGPEGLPDSVLDRLRAIRDGD